MQKSALSVFVFGIYLCLTGIVLILAPNVLLGLFGLPETGEVWIRVVGVLALIIGFYYIQTARMGLTGFFRLTLYTRFSVILFFGAFVLLGYISPPLLLFGAVDFAGALWTLAALRKENTSV